MCLPWCQYFAITMGRFLFGSGVVVFYLEVLNRRVCLSFTREFPKGLNSSFSRKTGNTLVSGFVQTNCELKNWRHSLHLLVIKLRHDMVIVLWIPDWRHIKWQKIANFITWEKVPNQFTRNIPPGDFIRWQKVADHCARGVSIIST